METVRLLSRAFLEAHPDDAARILERFISEEAAALLEEISPTLAAALLPPMAPVAGAECLGRMATDRAAAVIAELDLDAAALLLRRMELAPRARVLEALPDPVAGPLGFLLRYPEGTAGALMDPRVLALPHDLAVGEALARVRRAPRLVLYYLYVVDRRQALVGVLNLRELLLAPRHVALDAVMRPHVARLSARADRATIVAHPGWREFHALPVVDEAGAFVGVVRYETLRRLEVEPATGPEGPRAVGAVVSLGELCWSGFARVLTELAVAVAPRVRGAGEGGRGA